MLGDIAVPLCIGIGVAFLGGIVAGTLAGKTFRHVLNSLLRATGLDPDAGDEEGSEDEILAMVDLGEEKGNIEQSEKELIENVFEFNNSTAEDVMVHRTDMVLLWTDSTDEEILDTIRQTGLSRYPLCQEDADDVVGILNTRDYLLDRNSGKHRPLTELSRKAYFVPESVRADVLFRDMQSRKVHMAIVVDEYGGTAGLVTLEDLLEEIVGNIYDEFDPQEENDIVSLGDGKWRVSGGVDLETLGEALGVELPESEEYDTLGGLVFAQLSVIPEDGSRLEVEALGLHIRVEELADRRVEWAEVSLLPGETEEKEEVRA